MYKTLIRRHGQLINTTDLAGICGVSHSTIRQWLSVLEACYIIFRLQPYYQNFHKRLVKHAKLYFYDTGLVCHLLSIESFEHLQIHTSRGSIFEGFVLSEIQKLCLAKGRTSGMCFWANHNGFEVDLLMERGTVLHAVEIKSSATFSPDFCHGLQKWERMASPSVETKTWVVYAGEESFEFKNTQILSYRDLDRLIE